MKTTKTQNKASKKRNISPVLTGSVICVILIALPFCFYLYRCFPDVQKWETPFFTYESNYFENVQYSAHFIIGKVIPLIALTVWFLTNSKWWYHAIFPLIVMYVFQIVGAFNDDLEFIDEYEIIYVIPIALVIAPFLYFTRSKLLRNLILINLYEKVEKRKEELLNSKK